MYCVTKMNDICIVRYTQSIDAIDISPFNILNIEPYTEYDRGGTVDFLIICGLLLDNCCSS